MKHMMLIAVSTSLLAGCAAMPDGLFAKKKPAPEKPQGETMILEADVDTNTGEQVISDTARTVEEFDTTTTAERTAALQEGQSEGGERSLGTTVATLGAVADQGIWIKTPLVKKPGKGRVEYKPNGRSVAVDLVPLEGEAGAGSQLSLAAMRLLDVDLTLLAEVQVYQQ